LRYFASHTESRVEYDFQSAFAPLIDSAERFTAAARKYLADTAHASASTSASAAAEAARVFSDFLREQSIDFFELPWNAKLASGLGTTVPPAAALDMPALGLTREHQQRWQRTADAGRRIGDAQRRLQYLWSDALREAAAAFAARLAPPQQTTVSTAALRSLYDSWIECAEEAYARTAHSDTFCNALADFVNASSQWRAELQASMEHWAKSLDLPTRSELNSLTQRLKSVEAQLDAQRSGRKPRGAKSMAPRARRAQRGPKP
jgi:hypothetical protein